MTHFNWTQFSGFLDIRDGKLFIIFKFFLGSAFLFLKRGKKGVRLMIAGTDYGRPERK